MDVGKESARVLVVKVAYNVRKIDSLHFLC